MNVFSSSLETLLSPFSLGKFFYSQEHVIYENKI